MTAAYQRPILDSLASALTNVSEFRTMVQATDWILTELRDQVLSGNPSKSPFKPFVCPPPYNPSVLPP